MSEPGGCRLLLDGPALGSWNMAVDEVLLDRAAAGGGPSWRFYSWNEPTLSLGYFQNHADRIQHAPSLACPVVRRQTGGGAIVHDAELTYSVALPADHPMAARRERLYETVHGCLIAALARLDVAASICDGRPAGDAPKQSFLCFERRSPGDVLIANNLIANNLISNVLNGSKTDAWKIAGSAQRRRAGAVLQHGSVLLRRSTAAPELPGIEDILGHPIDGDSLAKSWLELIAPELRFNWFERRFDENERRRAEVVSKTRYAWAPWTENRSRPESEL